MRILTFALLLCTVPGAVAAQGRSSSPGRTDLAAGAIAGLVVGDDTDFLDGGIGPWAALRWQSGSNAFGLAGTVAWLPLAADTDGLTGARADNALFTALAGPTLSARSGPVRPWVVLLAGVAAVRSSQETGARSVHQTDTSFAWRSGVGLAVQVARSVALEAEAGVLGTGALSFARAPSPDSQASTGLLVRDVTMLSLRLGVRVEL